MLVRKKYLANNKTLIIILIISSAVTIDTQVKSDNASSELELFLAEHEKIYQPILQRNQEHKKIINTIDTELEQFGISPFFPKEDAQKTDSLQTGSDSKWQYSFDSFQNYINKPTLFSIGCISFVSFCLWTNYKIGKAMDTLAQDSWSLWRSEYSVDYLKSVPKETITNWLLDEIGKRYGQDHIKQFFKEIEAEEKLLHEIVRLYNIARYLPWFLDAESTAHAYEQLALLDYIKTVMVIGTLENARDNANNSTDQQYNKH